MHREKLPVVTLSLRSTKARGSQVCKADLPCGREQRSSQERRPRHSERRPAPGSLSPPLGPAQGRGDGQGDLLPLETLAWGRRQRDGTPAVFSAVTQPRTRGPKPFLRSPELLCKPQGLWPSGSPFVFLTTAPCISHGPGRPRPWTQGQVSSSGRVIRARQEGQMARWGHRGRRRRGREV